LTTAEDSSFSHGELEDVVDIPSFDDMGLPEELLRGIYSYGFEKPSAIQQRAIRPVMAGRDWIAQDQPGTGKTATFSIGLLARIDPRQPGGCQSIIVAPTRELAQQTFLVMTALAQHMKGIRIHVCSGVRQVRDDQRILRHGKFHVVVGTPGRVHLDLMQITDLLYINLVLRELMWNWAVEGR